jgi:hypothetical protein
MVNKSPVDIEKKEVQNYNCLLLGGLNEAYK